jgi:hypothetical protein
MRSGQRGLKVETDGTPKTVKKAPSRGTPPSPVDTDTYVNLIRHDK